MLQWLKKVTLIKQPALLFRKHQTDRSLLEFKLLHPSSIFPIQPRVKKRKEVCGPQLCTGIACASKNLVKIKSTIGLSKLRGPLEQDLIG